MPTKLIQDVVPAKPAVPADVPRPTKPVPPSQPRALAHLAPYSPPRPNIAQAHKPASPVRPIQAPRSIQPTISPVKPKPRYVPAPAVKPVTAAKPPAVAPRQTAPAKHRLAHPVRPTWRKRFIELAQYPLIAAIALLAANNTTIGQWLVLGYAVAAIALGIRSQRSFGAALFLLVAIPVFQLLGQTAVSQNIAIYVYELLVVGTIQAVIEMYKSRHKPA